MNILDKIVADKQIEVKLNKQIKPVSKLTNSSLFARNTISLSENLKNSKSGIIAEFKRKSPSKLEINMGSKVSDVAKGYEKAGSDRLTFLSLHPGEQIGPNLFQAGLLHA